MEFFLLFLFSCMFLALRKAQAKLEEHNRVFALLGEKHGGKVIRAKAIFTDLSLALKWDGHDTRIFEGYAAEGPFTEVRVFMGQSNLSGFRFELHPKAPVRRRKSLASYLKEEELLPDKGVMAKKYGLQEFPSGIKEFDGHFAIRTNKVPLAQEIFTDKICTLVSELQKMGDGGEVHLRLVKYAFSIRKLSRFQDAIELSEFHDLTSALSLSIFGHLLSHQSSHRPLAVEEATDEEVQLLPSSEEFPKVPVCIVCGDLVSGDAPIVRCMVCKAPSHEECWQYIGHCSTYGCSSTRSKIWPKEEH
mgnify:CR=1 FL=1